MKVLFPIKDGRITQDYSSTHRGYDIAPKIAGNKNTYIRFADSGKVVQAIGAYENSWKQGGDGDPTPGSLTIEDYGNYVKVECRDGYDLYAHLQPFDVDDLRRKIIKQGEEFVKVGSTGNSSGIHCHYERRDKNNRQVPVEFIFEEGGVSMTPFESFLDYQLTGPDYVTINIQDAPLDHNLDLGGTKGISALRDWAGKANLVVKLQEENKGLRETNNVLSTEIDQTRLDTKALVDKALMAQKFAEGQLQVVQGKLDTAEADLENLQEQEKIDKERITELEQIIANLQDEPLSELTPWAIIKLGISRIFRKGWFYGSSKQKIYIKFSWP